MVKRKRRWRQKGQSCGVGLFLGMPELLCPMLPPWRTEWAGESTELSHRSPAVGQQVESLAGKGVCWGRTVDGDCSSGSWASDRNKKGSRALASPTSTHPDLIPLVPTLMLTRGPSLLVQITFLAPTHPFLLGGGTSNTRSEPCLYLSLGLFIHPRRKVKNTVTYTRHQRVTSNGTAQEGSQSPSSQQAPRYPPNPFRLLCEDPSTLTPSILFQTKT